MQRFAMFVDGSNLLGAIKNMNLEVTDYGNFFVFVHEQAVNEWRDATQTPKDVATQLRRIYWYVVGSMDEWDLSLPSSQTALRKAFDADKEVKDQWLEKASRKDGTLRGTALAEKAWSECFADFKQWYEKKQEALEGKKRFHQAIRIGTDLIDVVETGHWKVNFLQKFLDEKGLDTSLAVDMLARMDNYDIGVVVSGDADSIPSVRYVKNRNKLVCAVEFVTGSPPEAKGRNFSSRLKEHADFVLRIYETDLIRRKLAHRPA